MTSSDKDLLASNLGIAGFAVFVFSISTTLLVQTMSLHSSWIVRAASLASLTMISFQSVLFWIVTATLALLIQSALGFGLIYGASYLSPRRVEAATLAFKCGFFPWAICFALLGFTTALFARDLSVILGLIFLCSLPLLGMLGQFLALRFVRQTAPPAPPKVLILDFDTLGALDTSLVQLLESKNLYDARHKAHACMMILGTACDPSSDEALTLLPERLVAVDRSASAMAISDLHVRLSEEN